MMRNDLERQKVIFDNGKTRKILWTIIGICIYFAISSTTVAVTQHLYCVYCQIQNWLGKDADPQQWGCFLNSVLEPIMTLLPPPSNIFLNFIFCNSTKVCSSRIKSGLIIVYSNCHGQSCLNATSDAISVDFSDSFDNIENDEINPIKILVSNMMDEENKQELLKNTAINCKCTK